MFGKKKNTTGHQSFVNEGNEGGLLEFVGTEMEGTNIPNKMKRVDEVRREAFEEFGIWSPRHKTMRNKTGQSSGAVLQGTLNSVGAGSHFGVSGIMKDQKNSWKREKGEQQVFVSGATELPTVALRNPAGSKPMCSLSCGLW